MLSENTGFQAIYIYCGKCDLRKGIDGLATLVKEQFHLDPFQKDVLFLFCGCRTDFFCYTIPQKTEGRDTAMAFLLKEKELANLDKQTLIKMLVAATESNQKLFEATEQLQKSVNLLTEEVVNLRQHRFGRSSEKGLTIGEYGCSQLCFAFNEAEMTIDLAPTFPEPELEDIFPKPYKRGKKKTGKRQEESKDVPVTVVIHTLSEEELLTAFPDGRYKKLPDEVYKRLEFHPASFEVIEHHVEVYVSADGGNFARAERPADLFRNSLATASLVAGIYNLKYVNAQPIERLSKEFERSDVFLPTQTLCRWAIMGAERYLSRVYARMKQKLPEYHVMHADETVVEVRKDGRPAGAESRKKEHAREFLKDFSGICVTDGYQVYHSIADEREDLTISGCWSHARRGFADVVKAAGKKDLNIRETVAYKSLQLIQTMSRCEEKFAKLEPAERLEARIHHILPLADAFFAYLKSKEDSVAQKSATGKAISYCLNQEAFLRVFLTDGYVPMTNNAAERSIRPFTVGRNNWFQIDTVSGAKASAIAYSIAETAKANQLKPYEYFRYLLEELPKHGELEELSYVEELLPWSETLPKCCYQKKETEN